MRYSARVFSKFLTMKQLPPTQELPEAQRATFANPNAHIAPKLPVLEPVSYIFVVIRVLRPPGRLRRC